MTTIDEMEENIRSYADDELDDMADKVGEDDEPSSFVDDPLNAKLEEAEKEVADGDRPLLDDPDDLDPFEFDSWDEEDALPSVEDVREVIEEVAEIIEVGADEVEWGDVLCYLKAEKRGEDPGGALREKRELEEEIEEQVEVKADGE